MRCVILSSLLLAGLVGCGGESAPPEDKAAAVVPTAAAAEAESSNPVNDPSTDAAAKPDETGAETPAEQEPPQPEADAKPPENVEPEKLAEVPGEEVQTNKVYDAGAALKVSAFGVSFKVPAGLRTAIQQGAEGFVVESTEKQVLGAIYMRREIKSSDLRELLTEDQDMGDGIVLRRQGSIEEKDGVMRVRYSDSMYVGLVAARLGEHGNGVAFFLASALADEAYIKQKVEALLESAKLAPPQESQDEKAWRELLSGHKLTYLRSNYSGGSGGSYTGSSTREEISLGADGSFHYYYRDSFGIDTGAAGGYSGGYGRGGDEDRGKWRVELAGSNIQLVLEGEEKTRRYNLAYSDSKTYLNGTRYFRVPLE